MTPRLRIASALALAGFGAATAHAGRAPGRAAAARDGLSGRGQTAWAAPLPSSDEESLPVRLA